MWLPVFFLLVFFAAITSLVSILEVPNAALMDDVTPIGNLVGVSGIAMVALSIVSITSFGMLTLTFLPVTLVQIAHFDVLVDVFYDTILPLNAF